MQEKTLEFLAKRIKPVEDAGLLPEVIGEALTAMKVNPSLSIEEAFQEGCYEYDI